MDDTDDDICVLQQPGLDDVDGSHGLQFVNHFTSNPPSSTQLASSHAFQKAYEELKKRLNETTQLNQQLQQKVNELEKAKDLSSDLGSFVTMSEDDFMPASGHGAADALGAQVAAEEGYIVKLKRELGLRNIQVAKLEKQLQELNQQKVELAMEKEVAKKQVLISLEEALQRCKSLEQEKEKILTENGILVGSLQKTSQELAILKEQQKGQSLNSLLPPELNSELVCLRNVIEKLKKIVCEQQAYLIQIEGRSSSLPLSVRSSINRTTKESMNMELDTSPLPSTKCSNSSGSATSGQSWELVNGVTHPSVDPRQQLTQQQHLQLNQQRMSVSAPPLSGGIDRREQQPGVWADQTTSAVDNLNAGSADIGRTPLTRKASTEIMRRKTYEDVQKTRSQTEYLRHSAPQTVSTAGTTWPGNTLKPADKGSSAEEQVQIDFPQIQPGLSGADQQQLKQQVSGIDAPAQYVMQPLVTPYYHKQYIAQLQNSHARELPSNYDNVPMASSSGSVQRPSSSNNSAVSSNTSIYYLNPSVMAGARVVKRETDSFGSGTSSPRSSLSQPSPPSVISRDIGARGSPQEHFDITAGQIVPSDTSSSPQSPHLARNSNQVQTQSSTKNVPSKKCPVCGQDFSHITMDEFQSHVFECFDDDDEEVNPPQTLQPQHNVSTTDDRVCPMCIKNFVGSTQMEFETHVQSHFEDVMDRFENSLSQRPTIQNDSGLWINSLLRRLGDITPCNLIWKNSVADPHISSLSATSGGGTLSREVSSSRTSIS